MKRFLELQAALGDTLVSWYVVMTLPPLDARLMPETQLSLHETPNQVVVFMWVHTVPCQDCNWSAFTEYSQNPRYIRLEMLGRGKAASMWTYLIRLEATLEVHQDLTFRVSFYVSCCS